MCIRLAHITRHRRAGAGRPKAYSPAALHVTDLSLQTPRCTLVPVKYLHLVRAGTDNRETGWLRRSTEGSLSSENQRTELRACPIPPASTSHNEQAIRMPACRLSNARARGTRHKIVTAAGHIRTIQQAAEQPHCVRRHQTQPAGRLGIRTTYMPCQYLLLRAAIPLRLRPL